MDALLVRIAERITSGADPLLSPSEALELARLPESATLDILSVAGLARAARKPAAAFTCGIINAKSGRCPENCAFCAQSAHHQTDSPVYPLYDTDTLLRRAEELAANNVDRFGIVNIGDPKHADVLLVTGTVNQRNKDVLKNLYDQMPEPKAVIAIGACACTGGVFQDCYNVVGGVDHVIPVDVYVPGCAAKPEAIIDGVVLALEVVKGKLGLRDMPQTTIFE